MNKAKSFFIIFFAFFFAVLIYSIYVNKNLKLKIEKIEAKLENQEIKQRILRSFNFFKDFAKEYGLISEEAKLMPSDKEYLFIYQFESREMFEKFVREKLESEPFKIWKESLKEIGVHSIKFVDRKNDILKVLKIKEI